jgi:Tfp pilus assembly protein PilV
MPNLRRPRRAGTTLIETLIALIILSIALIVMLDVLHLGGRVSQKVHYEIIALQAANDRLEQYKRTLFPDLPTSLTLNLPVTGLPSGQMDVRIAGLSGGGNSANIREVEVTVTWAADANNISTGGRVRLATMVSNKR